MTCTCACAPIACAAIGRLQHINPLLDMASMAMRRFVYRRGTNKIMPTETERYVAGAAVESWQQDHSEP